MSKTLDDIKGCSFPYLDYMIRTKSFSEVVSNAQLDKPFAKRIGCVCMDRILEVQHGYRSIYKMTGEMPLDFWFTRVLQDSQFGLIQFKTHSKIRRLC